MPIGTLSRPLGAMNDKGNRDLDTIKRAFDALTADLNQWGTTAFNVQGFGAIGNGLKNDGPAIRAAVAAINAAGGGVLYFPPGHYLNDGRIQPTVGNVHILGTPDSIIEQTSTDHTIVWRPAEGDVDFTTLTYYDMNGPVAIGATTITVTTPADLTTGGFAVGDYIWIRARQCITPPAGAVRQPVAEINQVRALDVGTGVVTLEWPTVKPYVDDVAYPFGIAKAQGNGAVYSRVMVSDLRIINPGPRWPIYIQSVVDASFERLILEGAIGAVIRGRFVRFTNNRCHINPVNTLGDGPYYVAPDTGCSDYTIAHNTFTSKGVGTIHLHEGLANILVDDNVCLQDIGETFAHTVAWGVVNIAGLSWDITIRNNKIINCLYSGIRGTDAALYAGEGNTRLRILDNTILGTIGQYGVFLQGGSDQPEIRGNRIPAACGTSSMSIASDEPVVVGNTATTDGSISGTNPRVLLNIGNGLQSELTGWSADRGDASVTIRVSEDVPIQLFATALGANRTVSLSATKTWNGARFAIVRTGLGAFTLDVGGLKTIPASTAATVIVGHDGTAWRLLAYTPHLAPSSPLLYADLPTGGGTWANGGALVLTGGNLTLESTRNLAVNGTGSFGTGAGVIGILSATTAPTTDPTGGGVLYVEGGALKFRGSSGTTTVVVRHNGERSKR